MAKVRRTLQFVQCGVDTEVVEVQHTVTALYEPSFVSIFTIIIAYLSSTFYAMSANGTKQSKPQPTLALVD